MASSNTFVALGNLTRDPDLRYTPKGASVCDLGLACNRKFTTESGEEREEVLFIDVVVWGKSAEAISKFGKKGNQVVVKGRLVTESWDDKQTGQKRSKIKCVAEEPVWVVGARVSNQDAEAPTKEARPAPPARTASRSATPPADPDDDVPF